MPGAAPRGEGVCLDLSDIRNLGTAQESKQQSTGQGWAASVVQGYSATGCQQTLQELQPKGDMQTYYKLVVITLLLLKVKYEECLINSLTERVKKDTQPPSVLLTYEPLHRCLQSSTDPHLERSQETFIWHQEIPEK